MKQRYSILASTIAILYATGLSGVANADDRVTSPSVTPSSGSVQITAEQRANAKPRMPMLRRDQLPQAVLEHLGLSADGRSSDAYGSGGHPFTTKRATTKSADKSTIKRQPYASTGKLWMVTSGGSTFVCTASLIGKGILVTAAHCVVDFGGDFVDTIWWEPSRHKTGGTPGPSPQLPFGTFSALNWWAPSAYINGTDVCQPGALGVVCENDVAVIALDTMGGQEASVIVKGRYLWKDKNYSYTSFMGEMSAQITQLGYPVSLDGGYKMIRTDSVGYQTPYNGVVIGSDQTGGSSGGPWLVNFGVSPVRVGNTHPLHRASNRVMATTSWGYVDSGIEIQGASRFGNNTAFPYPGVTNIEALYNAACAAFPSKC